MRILPPLVCALVFALPAKADKFWLSDPAAQKNAAAGSSPEVIEGVLLAEDADNYHVRVVGGELVLAKKSVFKVEKDGLKLDTIVKAEKDAAEALALANQERALQQQVAKKEREVRAAEASMRKSDKVAGAKAADADFDPVLRRAAPRADLVREAMAAYEQTGDRAYLKAARQLRRAQ
ncbi:MAG: hypothetical protein JNK15_12550 [Planctomycetes bacterium]|nr:hypothetical protein [Planctomycetota bacterium]